MAAKKAKGTGSMFGAAAKKTWKVSKGAAVAARVKAMKPAAKPGFVSVVGHRRKLPR